LLDIMVGNMTWQPPAPGALHLQVIIDRIAMETFNAFGYIGALV
jgi:hypothetical protein